MKKKIFSILLGLSLVVSSVGQARASGSADISNRPYEKTINANLENIDFQLNNGDLKWSLKNGAKLKNNDHNISNLVEILEHSAVKKNLINLINQGKKPAGIAIKDIYVEESIDPKTKKINDRFLTNAEVSALNSNTQLIGTASSASYVNTTRKGRLTLSITVIPSTSTYGQYWVQSDASWDLSGFFSYNTTDTPGQGSDFIAVGWDSKYVTLSNPSASGNYINGGSFTPYVSTIVPNQGTAWAFTDMLSAGGYQYGSTSVYAGVGVRSTGSTSFSAFTASYGHTWSSNTYSASFGYGAANITLSPTTNQWTTAVSYSGTFN